jgi:hypothetical protein
MENRRKRSSKEGKRGGERTDAGPPKPPPKYIAVRSVQGTTQGSIFEKHRRFRIDASLDKDDVTSILVRKSSVMDSTSPESTSCSAQSLGVSKQSSSAQSSCAIVSF